LSNPAYSRDLKNMNKNIHTNFLTRSGIALVMALAIWSPVQTRSAVPAEQKDMPKDEAMEEKRTQNTELTEPLASTTSVGQNKKGVTMKGFVQDIESIAIKNEEFRRVLYTAKNCQLVVMALKPKEEIGAEVHKLDQFFRIEEGSGEVILDGVRTAIRAGFAIVVPAGMNHNIINTGSVPLKLYTIYSPPNHRDGVVHHTRADAEADNEHFDGKTTE
jgi:mannose-6-phosphate isomerase-like protein (cupin superfamily)